jgi:hypothetical protein
MTPHRPCSSRFEHQQLGTNIDIFADRSSARMPTYIDTNAEPVLFLYKFFLFFLLLLSAYRVPLVAPCLCPIEARWLSEIFAP